MPGGAHSGGSRAQFAALQQHIDELTEEKLQLARGLQQQTRINEQLSEENGELMRQYNARGTMVEELQRKVWFAVGTRRWGSPMTAGCPAFHQATITKL